MTEIQMFETVLKGGAILRAGIGAEFRCCGPIVGEVWESPEGTIRCTRCAIHADKVAQGHRATAMTEATIHTLIGTQSAEWVEIED